MHFDWTISFGNLVSAFAFLFLAALAWRDLTWRVKNLETWRKEHQIDADSRDKIIERMDQILIRIETMFEERGARMNYTRRNDPPPYHGPERRKS